MLLTLVLVLEIPLFTQIAWRGWLELSLDEFEFCMSNQNFSFALFLF